MISSTIISNPANTTPPIAARRRLGASHTPNAKTSNVIQGSQFAEWLRRRTYPWTLVILSDSNSVKVVFTVGTFDASENPSLMSAVFAPATSGPMFSTRAPSFAVTTPFFSPVRMWSTAWCEALRIVAHNDANVSLLTNWLTCL